MDDGLQSKPIGDNTTSDDSVKTTPKVDDTLNKLPDDLGKPVTPPPAPTTPSTPLATPSTPQASLPSTPPAPPTPPLPPIGTEPEVKMEEAETVKPPSKLKRNGKKIVGGVLMMALLVGGFVVGRDVVQERTQVEQQAAPDNENDCKDCKDGFNWVWVKSEQACKKRGVCDEGEEDPADTVAGNYEIVEIQGRTIFIRNPDGSKRAITIKNEDVWRAMQAASNREGLDINELYKDLGTINDFNDKIYEDYIRNQVYQDKISGFSYAECVSGDSPCTQWETINVDDPDEIWRVIKETFDAIGKGERETQDFGMVYWCPDGFADKRTCNDGSLSIANANDLFFALTGSGEQGGQLCGAFQGDIGLLNIEGAETDDSIWGFEIPCEEEGEEPTPSPSPSPGPEYSCVGLTKDLNTVVIGDTVKFTCEASFSAVEPIIIFRHNLDGGAYQESAMLPADLDTGQAGLVLDIDEYGDYEVQCKVCTDTTQTSCTTWGQAN